jgi:hypothetical protein
MEINRNAIAGSNIKTIYNGFKFDLITNQGIEKLDELDEESRVFDTKKYSYKFVLLIDFVLIIIAFFIFNIILEPNNKKKEIINNFLTEKDRQ